MAMRTGNLIRTARCDFGLPSSMIGRLSSRSASIIGRVRSVNISGRRLGMINQWFYDSHRRIDRLGRDRTPSIPGHELAGVVTALSYGTTGLSVGQRVFGLSDWTRDGTLAEYVAVEARNLAPLPGDVDFTEGAALAMPGLTAW